MHQFGWFMNRKMLDGGRELIIEINDSLILIMDTVANLVERHLEKGVSYGSCTTNRISLFW